MRLGWNSEECERFVKQCSDYGESTLVRVWAHATGLCPVPAGVPHQLDSLLCIADNMPPWNKQHVLYLMAKHIDRIARECAKRAADHARVADPLP
jgi:hypothetical protein